MTETDGAELLARAAAGDRAAFEAFVRRWEGPLFRFLRRVTRDAHLADEARQRTFVRVLQRGSTFRGGAVSTWLFRTAFRIALDLLRSEGRRAAAPLDAAADVESADPTPFAAAETGDEKARVRAALDRLDPDERAMVWLRAAEGLSFAEAARVLSIPESTARLRFVRGLGRVRQRLGTGTSPASDAGASPLRRR
jgi:RNA polymerase sigma-70 factor (ECF subfamily)